MTTRWRKASFSGNQGNCVEIAGTLDEVRDSKATARTVGVPLESFETFVRHVKDDHIAPRG